MTADRGPITPPAHFLVAAGPHRWHTWSVSDPAPERAASPSRTSGSALSALAAAPLPKRHAVLVVAATVLAMSMILGRNDASRGPLWHMMWMLSLVVVLGGVLGAASRFLRRPVAPARTPAPRAEPPADRASL